MKECVGRVLYLMRHGDVRCDHVKRYIGQTDAELTELGRQQALQWSREFANVPLRTIFCSDLIRTRETADIIAQKCGAVIRLAPQFREINLGDWEGLKIDDLRFSHPLEYQKRGSNLIHFRPPHGENFKDVADRVVPYFDEAVRTSPGDLLIIGHSGVNRILLCHILGVPLKNFDRFQQDYACLNRIEYKDKKARLLAMNLPCPLSTSESSMEARECTV